MALSYPHFYKANVSLLNGVEGLKPNENQHGSYFDINPVSILQWLVRSINPTACKCIKYYNKLNPKYY